MGILNVIKLANDYNKLKKLVEKGNIDVSKVKSTIENVKKFLGMLEHLKVELQELIDRVKEILKVVTK